MNTGKCPKCDGLPTSILAESINISVNFQPKWKGVAFLCPYCRAILGTGIDPLAIKADIIAAIDAKKK